MRHEDAPADNELTDTPARHLVAVLDHGVPRQLHPPDSTIAP
jgi:hypothetical protein